MRNKLKHLALLILLIVCFNQFSQAQLYVGVQAGYNYNVLMSNTTDKPFYTYKPLEGYSVAVPVRYMFKKYANWFGGIQVEPSYILKSYRIQRTDFYAAQFQFNDNYFIDLPVMLNFHFGGKIGKKKTNSLHGLLNIGGFASYWVSGYIHGRAISPLNQSTYVEYYDIYSFDKTRDRRIQLGGVLGVGVKYSINAKYIFTLEGRYAPALTDLQKNYQEVQTPKYNDTYNVLVGVQTNLKSFVKMISKKKSAKK